MAHNCKRRVGGRRRKMMKKGLFLLAGLFLTASAFSAVDMAYGQKKKVGVLNFENSSTKKGEDIGRGISDMLVTSLVKSGKYDVVERSSLEKVLKEQKLGLSGFIDSDQAKKVGKILALDAMVMGKLTKYQEEIKQDIWTGYTKYIVRVGLDIRVVDIESGKIILAETAEGDSQKKALIYTDPYTGQSKVIEGTVGIDESMFSDAARKSVDNIMAKLAKSTPLEGLVAKVDGSEIVINIGSLAGVQKDMELKVFRKGEEIKDPATGQVLEVDIEEIAKIKIFQVSEKISKGKLSGKKKKDIQVGDVVSNK